MPASYRTNLREVSWKKDLLGGRGEREMGSALFLG